MPTYDYRCENCHAMFLVMENFNLLEKDKEIICSNCGSKNVTKLINKGVNVIFKGEGFYTTDNEKKKDNS